MDTLKEIEGLADEKRMSSNEYRHRVRTETLRYLMTEKNFDIGDYLGEGTYGEVFSANSPDYESSVAVKIVCLDDVWTGEIALWPTMDHPNVLPLLDIIEVPYACLFVTPVLFKDMETFLEEETFIYEPMALDIAKTWLTGILGALDYLHRRKLCHLDIKADNVLIDYDLKAVLSDFSFINNAGEFTERYGVPIPYRPPETCLAFEKEITVDAVSFEMWCFGILALNVLTGHFLKHRVHAEAKYWHKDIYPLLFEATQVTYFRVLMIKAFPLSNTLREFTNAFNFIQYILRFQPKDRPSVEMTQQHSFFRERGLMLEKPDDIWLFYEKSNCSCMKPVKYKRQCKDYYDLFKFRKNFKKSFVRFKKRRSWVKHSKCKEPEEKALPSIRCNSEIIWKHNDGNFKRSILVESALPNKTPDHAVSNDYTLESDNDVKRDCENNCFQSFAIGDVLKSCKNESCIFDNPIVIMEKDIKVNEANHGVTKTTEAEKISHEEIMLSDAQDETKQLDVKKKAHTKALSPLASCDCKNYEQDEEEIFQKTDITENASLKNSPSNSIPDNNPFESRTAEKEENSMFFQTFKNTDDGMLVCNNNFSVSKELQNTVNVLTEQIKCNALSKEIETVSTEESMLPETQNELKHHSANTDDVSITIGTKNAAIGKRQNKIRICEWFIEKVNAFYLNISKRNKEESRNENMEHV